MVNEQDQRLMNVLSGLVNLVIFLLALVFGLGILLYHYMPDYKPSEVVESSLPNFSQAPAVDEVKDTTTYWHAPDEATLQNDPNKELILYGKDIIAHTSDYYGPNGKIFKATINGMNCQNCHLDAGAKIYGNNYSAVASTYPKFRARSGAVEDMYKRINDCFERSMNGKKIDSTSKEMQGMVAYMKWLGKDVPKGTKPAGAGFKRVAFLERAANPENGKNSYSQKCASCHQADGQGLMNGDNTAYTYPPLWGKNSYNDGAGLYRLSNFAAYIKSNMPLGASYSSPQLSDEESWDIAAFVNSQERPHKSTKKDWPNIEAKPFDHPFGPYADGFTETQHKYGPYQPIKEKMAAVAKK